MNDVIEMTIFQSTSNLPRKLSRDTFTQTTVTDDVVQHLTAIDILENHIIVMLMDYHFSHATYVGMIKKHGERSFAKSSDLFRGIFGSLARCGVGVDARAIHCRGWVWVNSREYFNSQLGERGG